MKSHILLALLMFLITACGGNPHIHSSRGGLESSTSNQESDPGCLSARSIMGYEFFISAHSSGKAGSYPSGFRPFTKCKSLIKETFNPFENGFTYLITNSDREDMSFELRHLVEKGHPSLKNPYLEDIFSEESYAMEIENPVQQDGTRGEDKGVDSNDANLEARDALVWSFPSPIVTWGVHVVNLESEKGKAARLRLFDCNRALVREIDVIYPGQENGLNENHFIGFVSGLAEVCHVSLSSAHESGSVLVDELIYGR